MINKIKTYFKLKNEYNRRYKCVNNTIKFWTYLEKHPDIQYKHMAPRRIYRLVEKYKFTCGLCELFLRESIETCRYSCPLYNRASGDCFLYNQWVKARSADQRQYYAVKIVTDLKEYLTQISGN